MAASTITRDTWTNDTGSAAAPNADGTLLTNTVLQNHLYARVDAMFAGAGAYATLTLGGLLAAEGFGQHNFSAGGTGQHRISVRNTSAGTGNLATLDVGNDTSELLSRLFALSSTFTTSGQYIANSTLLEGIGAGGVSVSSNHASGVIRFFTNNSERARINTTGQLLIGDTANADVTSYGLTVKNTDGGHAIALKGGVAHGLAAAETDTYGFFREFGAGAGGLEIYGLVESGGGFTGIFLNANLGSAGHTTKDNNSQGAVMVRGMESGNPMTGNANIFAVNTGGPGGFTRFILDADGDSHQDVGTAWTNFDDHDDIALLHALSAGVSRFGDPLREQFGALLEQHRETLAMHRIVTFNDDGHHFINWSRAHMLTIGAVRQIGMRQQALLDRLEALEQRVS